MNASRPDGPGGEGVVAGGSPEIDRLARSVVESATDRGLRIAVAESLTGGLLAHALVSVPGASLVFSGGIVAYDTFLKSSLLGVDAGLLLERGPVDEEVARQMALGARSACAVADGIVGPAEPGEPGFGAGSPRLADLGVATTGVAGPDPDPQTGQAAGTVWLGLSADDETRAVPLRLRGDRSAIRSATVAAALRMLLERLERG